MMQFVHNPMTISYEDIDRAAQILNGIAHKTPVMTSTIVNDRTQSQVFFKCENFQRTGSFKFRGAYHALSKLSPADRKRGAIAYSSGNHAQGMALAGQLLDMDITIVMPSDAPQVKQQATRDYGAQIIFYDRATQTRESVAQDVLEKTNAILIPPFDHPDIIAGQGTVVKELIEEVGDLDFLLVCVGGGGLISGSAIAAHALSPHCQVIGVEPKLADDATRSFLSGKLERIEKSNTIADGARSPSLGELTFPIVLEQVQDMVTVSDAAIARSLFYLWERLKIVVEPTGALAATAILEGIVNQPGAKIGVIVSGGNVDLSQMPTYWNKAFPKKKETAKRPWTWELS
jgi:threo-3-hydroxy-L-aspartate ammonia-lyase